MKPEHRVETRRLHFHNLFRRERTAMSVVAGHLSLRELLFPKGFEPLFGAKTLIALSFLRESVSQFTIEGHPLGLTIRTHGPVSIRAFVP
jgi:chorismate-pyruvate lyase